ncbi:hypothetical protein D3C86_1906190 [compost metagenome]
MEVVHLGRVGRGFQIDFAGQQVRQAVVNVFAEQFVQVTLAHVGVNQQHLLPCLGDDGR